MKEELRRAHIKERPASFIRKVFMMSIMGGIAFGFLGFVFADKSDAPMIIVPIIAAMSFFGIFGLFLGRTQVEINRKRRELDREVLHIGRFLLIKLHSGRPLISALVEGSHSYGVGSKYFKEIVDDVNLGTPIEKSIDNAVRYSPSDKLRKILFQISNALKIGIDITGPLTSVLEEIANDQLTEIQRYGKKLNSLALFYMLIAVVMPSLGIAMLVVIGNLVGIIQEDQWIWVFFLVGFMLVVLQFIFLSIFKSTRMSVEL